LSEQQLVNVENENLEEQVIVAAGLVIRKTSFFLSVSVYYVKKYLVNCLFVLGFLA